MLNMTSWIILRDIPKIVMHHEKEKEAGLPALLFLLPVWDFCRLVRGVKDTYTSR